MAENGTTTPTDPVILAANREAAQSAAVKAAAEAKTASIQAQTTELAAEMGKFPDSGTTGAVTVKADAGKGEAILLSVKAARTGAAKIVAAVGPHVKDKVVRIYAGDEQPSLDRWAGFNFKLTLLETGVEPGAAKLDQIADITLANLGLSKPAAGAQTAPLAAIAVGATTITAISKLFQTDYEVGGIALNPDDPLLASLVAGELTRATRDKPKTVYLAGRTTHVGADASLLDILKPMAEKSVKATARIAYFQERAKAVRADAKASDPAMIDAAAACDQAVAALQVVVTGYDNLLSAATTPDSTGALPITKIAVEKQLSDQLNADDADAILFVKMNSSVGGYYTQKNIWTTLGAMPFYIVGGVVVSYALVAGKGGELIAADAIPVHGGYFAAPEVAAKINGK